MLINTRTPLTNQQIAEQAPAVFGVDAKPGLSRRYTVASTGSVVDRLRDLGWVPVFCAQSRARDPENRPYRQHLVTFFRHDALTVEADDTAELRLTNSHDGTTAYHLDVGIWRRICRNGLVENSGEQMGRIKIRHVALTPQRLVEASQMIVDRIPAVMANVRAMKNHRLTDGQARRFARLAIEARWGRDHHLPVTPDDILWARRPQDHGDDLWTTTNVIQENVLRGGLRNPDCRRPDGQPFRRHTAPVTALQTNTRINRVIWGTAIKILTE